MNNLLYSICVVGFCSTLVLSCNKDDGKPDVEPAAPCDRIEKVVRYGFVSNDTTFITYDDKGRVSHIKAGGKNEATYTYYKDSIVVKATDNIGIDISRTYFLDIRGRVRRTSYYDNRYTYNYSGYLVGFRQPILENAQFATWADYTLTWKNGDLVEMYTTKANAANRKVNFKYYDEPNQQLLGYHQPLYLGTVLGDRNTFYLIAAGFFGKQPAHLLKNVGINDQWDAADITYTKDANGRVNATKYMGFGYQCP
jgi:hypothetical protein